MVVSQSFRSIGSIRGCGNRIGGRSRPRLPPPGPRRFSHGGIPRSKPAVHCRRWHYSWRTATSPGRSGDAVTTSRTSATTLPPPVFLDRRYVHYRSGSLPGPKRWVAVNAATLIIIWLLYEVCDGNAGAWLMCGVSVFRSIVDYWWCREFYFGSRSAALSPQVGQDSC